ncbi:MAG: hypothetical protein H0U74_02985 [Bradymonadaceae bacterium]|nr:hypothetical protein [Lujinxingiaceae bacterium]
MPLLSRTNLFLTMIALLVGLGGCSDDSAASGDARVEQYIRAQPFPRLVLEIESVAGSEPYGGTEARLIGRLAQILDKPGGIEAIRDETIASRGAHHAWSFDELDALAAQRFNLEVDSDTIKMLVMFVDGHYAEDSASSKVLGIAWRQKYLVIFKQTIESSCRKGALIPSLQDKFCQEAELTIWTHEIGHLLGLVDNGLPMQNGHRDHEHGRHCTRKECVMYWAYTGNDLFDVLQTRFLAGNEQSPGFGPDCLADLKAVREK